MEDQGRKGTWPTDSNLRTRRWLAGVVFVACNRALLFRILAWFRLVDTVMRCFVSFATFTLEVVRLPIAENQLITRGKRCPPARFRH